MPQGRLAWQLAFATVLVKGQSRDYGCHNMMYELRSEPRAMVGIAEQIMYRVRLVVWYMVWLKLIPSYVSELGKQKNALNPTMYQTTSPTLKRRQTTVVSALTNAGSGNFYPFVSWIHGPSDIWHLMSFVRQTHSCYGLVGTSLAKISNAVTATTPCLWSWS